MSNLISRRKAMMEARPEYLNPNQKGHEECNKAWNDAIKAYWNGLKELPPELEWIPVTERLPKEHTMVLACWHDIRRGHEDAYSIIPSWVEHEQWRSSAGFIYRKVTAWMPLPEPYKGGDNE